MEKALQLKNLRRTINALENRKAKLSDLTPKQIAREFKNATLNNNEVWLTVPDNEKEEQLRNEYLECSGDYISEILSVADRQRIDLEY